jgi:hypothetical protein
MVGTPVFCNRMSTYTEISGDAYGISCRTLAAPVFHRLSRIRYRKREALLLSNLACPAAFASMPSASKTSVRNSMNGPPSRCPRMRPLTSTPEDMRPGAPPVRSW